MKRAPFFFIYINAKEIQDIAVMNGINYVINSGNSASSGDAVN